MTQVLITKPGALTAKDKIALRRAGVVPIEAAEPDDVRLIQMEGPDMVALPSGDTMFAALTAIAGANATVSDRFTNVLLELMAKARKAK